MTSTLETKSQSLSQTLLYLCKELQQLINENIKQKYICPNNEQPPIKWKYYYDNENVTIEEKIKDVLKDNKFLEYLQNFNFELEKVVKYLENNKKHLEFINEDASEKEMKLKKLNELRLILNNYFGKANEIEINNNLNTSILSVNNSIDNINVNLDLIKKSALLNDKELMDVIFQLNNSMDECNKINENNNNNDNNNNKLELIKPLINNENKKETNDTISNNSFFNNSFLNISSYIENTNIPQENESKEESDINNEENSEIIDLNKKKSSKKLTEPILNKKTKRDKEKNNRNQQTAKKYKLNKNYKSNESNENNTSSSLNSNETIEAKPKNKSMRKNKRNNEIIMKKEEKELNDEIIKNLIKENKNNSFENNFENYLKNSCLINKNSIDDYTKKQNTSKEYSVVYNIITTINKNLKCKKEKNLVGPLLIGSYKHIVNQLNIVNYFPSVDLLYTYSNKKLTPNETQLLVEDIINNKLKLKLINTYKEEVNTNIIQISNKCSSQNIEIYINIFLIDVSNNNNNNEKLANNLICNNPIYKANNINKIKYVLLMLFFRKWRRKYKLTYIIPELIDEIINFYLKINEKDSLSMACLRIFQILFNGITDFCSLKGKSMLPANKSIIEKLLKVLYNNPKNKKNIQIAILEEINNIKSKSV